MWATVWVKLGFAYGKPRLGHGDSTEHTLVRLKQRGQCTTCQARTYAQHTGTSVPSAFCTGPPQERQFPPLRLDKAEEDDEDPSDDNASRASEDYPAALQQKAATHALVRNGTLSAAAAVNLVQEVFYSIQALLCMVKGDMRKKMLKDLCKQWHIQVPPSQAMARWLVHTIPGGGGGGLAVAARQVMDGLWTEVWGQQKTVKRPQQQPAQPPIRQLLGAADAQTAHPATSSTAPAHQRRGSANAETTPARAQAAAADKTQRPDATCEGKNG